MFIATFNIREILSHDAKECQQYLIFYYYKSFYNFDELSLYYNLYY